MLLLFKISLNLKNGIVLYYFLTKDKVRSAILGMFFEDIKIFLTRIKNSYTKQGPKINLLMAEIYTNLMLLY